MWLTHSALKKYCCVSTDGWLVCLFSTKQHEIIYYNDATKYVRQYLPIALPLEVETVTVITSASSKNSLFSIMIHTVKFCPSSLVVYVLTSKPTLKAVEKWKLCHKPIRFLVSYKALSICNEQNGYTYNRCLIQYS